MSLLDLIQQHDIVRPTSHGLSELAAGIVADVPASNTRVYVFERVGMWARTQAGVFVWTRVVCSRACVHTGARAGVCKTNHGSGCLSEVEWSECSHHHHTILPPSRTTTTHHHHATITH